MKKSIGRLGMVLILVLGVTNAQSASVKPVCSSGTCNNFSWSGTKNAFVGCISCTCGNASYRCIECATSNDCSYGYTCSGNKCVEKCTGCTNCNSEDWTAYGTGYQRSVTRTCSCNTCKTAYNYRCDNGWYGMTLNGTNGCSNCASATGVNNATSDAGNNTLINHCYIAPGDKLSNATGYFEFNDKCYYTP